MKNPGLRLIVFTPVSKADFFSELIRCLHKNKADSTELLLLCNEAEIDEYKEEFADVCVNLKAAKSESKRKVVETAYRELCTVFEGVKILPALHKLLVPEYPNFAWAIHPIVNDEEMDEIRILCNVDMRFFYKFLKYREDFIDIGELPSGWWFKSK